MKALSVLSIFVATATFAVVSFLALQRWDRYLNLKAMSDCATNNRLEYVDTAKNTRIFRVLDEPYKDCLIQTKSK